MGLSHYGAQGFASFYLAAGQVNGALVASCAEQTRFASAFDATVSVLRAAVLVPQDPVAVNAEVSTEAVSRLLSTLSRLVERMGLASAWAYASSLVALETLCGPLVLLRSRPRRTCAPFPPAVRDFSPRLLWIRSPCEGAAGCLSGPELGHGSVARHDPFRTTRSRRSWLLARYCSCSFSGGRAVEGFGLSDCPSPPQRRNLPSAGVVGSFLRVTRPCGANRAPPRSS